MKHFTTTILGIAVILCACSPIAPMPTPPVQTELPELATPTLLLPTIMPVSTTTPANMTGIIPVVESWEGVPVMPGAISGMFEMGDYVYTIEAKAEEITAFYERAMPDLGWQPREDKTRLAPGTAFTYYKDGTFVFFMIQSKDGKQTVYMHFVHQ